MARITAEAARALRVPVVWIGLMGTAREEIVAATGSAAKFLSLDNSFASRVRGGTDVIVIPDTAEDPRFASHPLVLGAPHIRFFAMAPIVTDGFPIGAISVLDRVPRQLTDEQIILLDALSALAAGELAMRDELIEADERFRDFFEVTSDLIMSIGPNGTLLHANETAMNMLGIAGGASLLRSVDPERRDEWQQHLTEVFERGEPERIETVFVTGGGNRVTLEGWLRPKLMDGRAVLARVIFRDVTDRKQFEAELGNARDAALEAARAKTHFLANVSHEIRTPMNGIVGMIDLLLGSRLDVEQQDFAHQARASAEQLLSVVNNILYISNLQSASLASSTVDFDLQRSLLRIVEVMKIAALGKDLDIGFDYDPALPAVFRGNHAKLRQVLTNLLENAIKFTEAGRVMLTVTQQTETETHRVLRFEVRDTGIGITDEERTLLFERFAQVEDTSTRRFGGVGLGLATARHLVETMGGLIDVESEPGKGSTFWFTVPLPKVSGDRRPVVSSDLDLKGRRVLLVDSHPTSRKVARHYLETSWEMRVTTARNAAESLALLREAAATDPYRLVLFDVMDDMGALEFARAVRADERIAGVGLVYLVPSGIAVNEEPLRAAGIQSYAVKPVGQRELFDAIAIAVAHDAVSMPRAPVHAPKPVTFVPREERKSVRILLAEDNFLNMKLTMSQLQKLGYEAVSAANGKEALEALAERRFDVVLMDCQMPILDGYDATAEIRRRETRGEQRHYIIAMTANALEGDREKCLAAGMDDYLAKPTRQEDLEQALARFFG